MDSQNPLPTRNMGAYPPRGTGIHPRAGEPRGSAGGDGPTAAGAGAADLAHLVASTVERPTPGRGQTAASPEPTGRRPGGQPGHEGQARALVPVEEVDVAVPVKPERCQHCQHLWQGEDPQPSGIRRPKSLPKPVVTEYQLHRLCCPACGEETRAEVPSGVPTGASARGSRRSRPCVRGPIICRTTPRSAPWKICLAARWGWGRSPPWSTRRCRR